MLVYGTSIMLTFVYRQGVNIYKSYDDLLLQMNVLLSRKYVMKPGIVVHLRLVSYNHIQFNTMENVLLGQQIYIIKNVNVKKQELRLLTVTTTVGAYEIAFCAAVEHVQFLVPDDSTVAIILCYWRFFEMKTFTC